jgi:hypothetical protein
LEEEEENSQLKLQTRRSRDPSLQMDTVTSLFNSYIFIGVFQEEEEEEKEEQQQFEQNLEPPYPLREGSKFSAKKKCLFRGRARSDRRLCCVCVCESVCVHRYAQRLWV